uniref:NADH-ubiquinone oxidoreductase chain 2 n=1 Tax=Laomedia healyi TaxID=576627 RepID=A0A4Y5QJG5_9EUCA|nr:NADH dehydrogenase subunit 2 [Laomedia healyi]QCX31765.1 NADH dehydrogenase subunit 2 [Laomedia healyi]
MRISNFQLLFLITMILGIILCISSSTWFGAWVGLELNLMSFIPFISTKMNQFSSEASLKYFLIQALSSATIILASSLLILFFYPSQALITIALLLKTGAAPFHFWFPQIMEGLMWPEALILMTVQKIAPMFLLTLLSNSSYLMLTSAILSATVGALGGMNQILLRSIMAFSSINHMGWMLSALLINEYLWIYYFLIYSIMTSSAILLFSLIKMNHLSQIINLKSTNPLLMILLSFILLSLGGLPPFLGFFPKWLIIQKLVEFNLPLILPFLIFSALGTLYYYLRIITPLLMIKSPKMLWLNIPAKMSTLNILLIFTNILGLFFTILIYSL